MFNIWLTTVPLGSFTRMSSSFSQTRTNPPTGSSSRGQDNCNLNDIFLSYIWYCGIINTHDPGTLRVLLLLRFFQIRCGPGQELRHKHSMTDQSLSTSLPTLGLSCSKPHVRWHTDLSPNGKHQLGLRCTLQAFEESTENNQEHFLIIQSQKIYRCDFHNYVDFNSSSNDCQRVNP